MTDQQARTVANGVMLAAAVGAAVLVLRSPRLRRMAWQLARLYVRGPVAVWVAGTVRDAWDQSASASTPARPMTARVAADVSAGDSMIAGAPVGRTAAALLSERAAASRPV